MDDYGYEGVDDYGGRILWGRIAVFGGALLLALLLGRCTAGGGVSEAEFTALQEENAQLREANQELEQTVTELQTRLQDLISEATEQPTTSPDGTTATEATTPPTPQSGQTYIVQPGDTLSGIASQVYGDPTKFGIIAEANGITESNPLQVGQELVIPPNPDA